MFKKLGAAVAAISLAFAGSASAAVLFQKSETLSGGRELHAGVLAWPYGDGTPSFPNQPIKIEINYSTNSAAPNLVGVGEYRLEHFWEFGNSEYSELPVSFSIDGTTTVEDVFSVTGTPGSLVAIVTPPADRCQAWDGTFRCQYYWMRGFALVLLAQPGETLTYDLTISSFESSAVPEPATWLMLIAGFGLAGTALRRRQAAMFQKSPI